MKDARKQTLRVFPAKRALDDFACREWAEVGRLAIGRNGRFAAALSGGRTPVSFYERLAADGSDLPWDKTHIFLADERCVPFSHPDSNYGMIEAKLIRHVPIPPGNIHPVRTRLEPPAAAADYETGMRAFFGLRDGEFPAFDLILLGLGEDGHTASLFPRDTALSETRRLAVAVARAAPDHHRISVTLPVINRAGAIIFMVAGGNKAAVLKAVLEGPEGGLPAALVRPSQGRALFLADKDAASLLQE